MELEAARDTTEVEEGLGRRVLVVPVTAAPPCALRHRILSLRRWAMDMSSYQSSLPLH